MKKPLFKITTIFALWLSLFQNSFADTSSSTNTTLKNLDKIEKVWYFHSAELTGDSCWGWAWDFRFRDSWSAWFNKYSELKDLFSNTETSISCMSTSIWMLNNIAQIQEKNQFWTIYTEPNWKNSTSPENINKTWTDEYMLIPSKDFMWNLSKNSLFKDKTNKNDLLSYIQSDFFKWKEIKIIWRYYHIKGNYKYSSPFLWEQNLDLDLNIIIVDDINLVNTDTKVDVNVSNIVTTVDTTTPAIPTTKITNSSRWKSPSEIRKINANDTVLQETFTKVDTVVYKLISSNTLEDEFNWILWNKMKNLTKNIANARLNTTSPRKLQLLDYLESELDEKYSDDIHITDLFYGDYKQQ